MNKHAQTERPGILGQLLKHSFVLTLHFCLRDHKLTGISTIIPTLLAFTQLAPYKHAYFLSMTFELVPYPLAKTQCTKKKSITSEGSEGSAINPESWLPSLRVHSKEVHLHWEETLSWSEHQLSAFQYNWDTPRRNKEQVTFIPPDSPESFVISRFHLHSAPSRAHSIQVWVFQKKILPLPPFIFKSILENLLKKTC